MLIWSSNGQADWFIAADDAASLEEALRAVWNIDGVGQRLYECSEIGSGVLARLEAGHQI